MLNTLNSPRPPWLFRVQWATFSLTEGGHLILFVAIETLGLLETHLNSLKATLTDAYNLRSSDLDKNLKVITAIRDPHPDPKRYSKDMLLHIVNVHSI